MIFDATDVTDTAAACAADTRATLVPASYGSRRTGQVGADAH